MKERGHRIASLANAAVGRGVRFTAADRHADAWHMAREITGAVAEPSQDVYNSFLAGWDDAMATRFEELMTENSELHGMVLDLCARLATRRCDHCQGHGVDLDSPDFAECPHCDSGWVDVPAGEAEKAIEELKAKRKLTP